MIPPPYPFPSFYTVVGKTQSQLKKQGRDKIWWNVRKINPNSSSITDKARVPNDSSERSITELNKSAIITMGKDDHNHDYHENHEDELVLNPEWIVHFDRMLKDYDKKKRQRSTKSRKEWHKKQKR